MTNPEELADLNRRIAVCLGWQFGKASANRPQIMVRHVPSDNPLGGWFHFSPASEWADAGPLLEEMVMEASHAEVTLYLDQVMRGDMKLPEAIARAYLAVHENKEQASE